MPEGGSLINLGELSKPATVLIEKIAEATGGVFRPFQIRRVAQAEADAKKIETVANIEIADLERRALHRFLHEEAKKQVNIESITQKALPAIGENAQPEKIEDDWITNFFDKCRLISDDQMQNLWAKVLAGEANNPGKFSKRTVNLLASLDKADAELFRNLCSFGWVVGNLVPLIYDVQGEIYNKAGINFTSLKHLDSIGLVSIETLAGYLRAELPQKIEVFYYGAVVMLEFEKLEKNMFDIGKVLLSKAGQDLTQICGSTPRDGFKDYVLNKWRSLGYKILNSPQQVSAG